MDAAGFLGLEVDPDDQHRARLPVVPAICSGLHALFGGAGLAAGVVAMERAAGRPLLWATAQFLRYARPPAVLDVEVELLAVGARITQARAVLRDGAEPVVVVSGSLGARPGIPDGTWAARPEAPRVEDCAVRALPERFRGTMLERIETRLAVGRQLDELDGTQGDGRSSLWLRVDGIDPGAGLLAIIGDFVPVGMAQALGHVLRSNSLDNSIRMVDPSAAGGWMLADVRIHAIRSGIGHGLIHLWSQDGRLLATATQTAVARPWTR